MKNNRNIFEEEYDKQEGDWDNDDQDWNYQGDNEEYYDTTSNSEDSYGEEGLDEYNNKGNEKFKWKNIYILVILTLLMALLMVYQTFKTPVDRSEIMGEKTNESSYKKPNIISRIFKKDEEEIKAVDDTERTESLMGTKKNIDNLSEKQIQKEIKKLQKQKKSEIKDNEVVDNSSAKELLNRNDLTLKESTRTGDIAKSLTLIRMTTKSLEKMQEQFDSHKQYMVGDVYESYFNLQDMDRVGQILATTPPPTSEFRVKDTIFEKRDNTISVYVLFESDWTDEDNNKVYKFAGADRYEFERKNEKSEFLCTDFQEIISTY